MRVFDGGIETVQAFWRGPVRVVICPACVGFAIFVSWLGFPAERPGAMAFVALIALVFALSTAVVAWDAKAHVEARRGAGHASVTLSAEDCGATPHEANIAAQVSARLRSEHGKDNEV